MEPLVFGAILASNQRHIALAPFAKVGAGGPVRPKLQLGNRGEMSVRTRYVQTGRLGLRSDNWIAFTIRPRWCAPQTQVTSCR
jgi:hypothetical protein